MRMAGKVAIVSGGGGAGIGRAIAARFAREGAAVAVGDLNEDGARSVARAIESAGGRAVALRADAADGGDVQRLVRAALDSFGSLTTVVNVAAGAVGKPLHEVEEAEWDRALGAGLTSVYLTARYALPEMIRAGRRGRALDRQHLLRQRGDHQPPHGRLLRGQGGHPGPHPQPGPGLRAVRDQGQRHLSRAGAQRAHPAPGAGGSGGVAGEPGLLSPGADRGARRTSPAPRSSSPRTRPAGSRGSP